MMQKKGDQGTLFHKIAERINKELNSKELLYAPNTPAHNAILKRYEKANAILSGWINSLDFVICSITKGIKHSQTVWNFEYKRALR